MEWQTYQGQKSTDTLRKIGTEEKKRNRHRVGRTISKSTDIEKQEGRILA